MNNNCKKCKFAFSKHQQITVKFYCTTPVPYMQQHKHDQASKNKAPTAWPFNPAQIISIDLLLHLIYFCPKGD